MNVSLRQAQIFVVVAETLHFGRAAERLFVSQSVISQELKRFEQRLGYVVFERSTRRVSLTPAGESILAAASRLLEAAHNFELVAQESALGGTRSIHLVATPSAMNELVPRAIRKCEELIPDVNVLDSEVETGGVESALLENSADVGIGRFLDLPSRFRVETIREEPLLVVLSALHPMARENHADLAALGDLPLLLWDRGNSPTYFDHLIAVCQDGGLDPILLMSRPRVIGSRSYFLVENRAFTLIPQSASTALPAGTVARPIEPTATVPLSMAWRGDDTRPRLHDFIQIVRSAAGEDG